jgi:hypothetical protein
VESRLTGGSGAWRGPRAAVAGAKCAPARASERDCGG